jgi:hypothetical protein
MGGDTLSKRPIALLAGVLAVALVAAGCGGSSAPLTKAELIEQGDAICAQGAKQIQTEATAFINEKDPKEKQVGLTTAEYSHITKTILIPMLKQEVEEVRALKAPSGEEKKVAALFAVFAKGVKASEKEPGNIYARAEALAQANKALQAYGFKSCGKT